jgi:hypothetical protein
LEYVVIQTFKGGFAMGTKFGTFGGVGLGIALLLSVYKNKSSPLDYALGLCKVLFCGFCSLIHFIFKQ